jgi:site-specific recombinase XerD
MSELTTIQDSAVTVTGGDPGQWEVAARSWLDNFKSERTRQTYKIAWRQFMNFSGVTPPDATADHLIAWTKAMRDRSYSQATINVKLSAVSSFYEFVRKRGLIALNPAATVKRESVTPYGKATVLDTDAGDDLRLIASIETETEQGKRDRAILLLLLSRALRVGSVAGLRVDDVRRVGDKTFVTVDLKGGETQELQIAPETAAAIEDYLAMRGDLAADDPLFVATEAGKAAAALLGHSAGENPLTPQAIRAVVRSRCNAVFGRGHGITPHSLRHTAAARASKDGATVAGVSRLLTHKNRATTLIYLESMSSKDEVGEIVGKLGGRYRGL